MTDFAGTTMLIKLCAASQALEAITTFKVDFLFLGKCTINPTL